MTDQKSKQHVTLAISNDLKMTTISQLTEVRIKELTMDDLKEIFAAIEESEARLIVKAIKDGRFDKVAHVIEFLTYQVIQKKVTG